MKKLLKESLNEYTYDPKRKPDIDDFSEVFHEFYDNLGEMTMFMDDKTIEYLKHAQDWIKKAWEHELKKHNALQGPVRGSWVSRRLEAAVDAERIARDPRYRNRK
jgi:hypothetical protein